MPFGDNGDPGDDMLESLVKKMDQHYKQAAEAQQDTLTSRNVMLATINTPEVLIGAYETYFAQSGIQEGCIARWKPGMCNRTVGGPFIVVELVSRDKSLRQRAADNENATPSSPLYLEHLDCRVAFVSPDQTKEVLMYWLDSARLERVPGTQLARVPKKRTLLSRLAGLIGLG